MEELLGRQVFQFHSSTALRRWNFKYGNTIHWKNIHSHVIFYSLMLFNNDDPSVDDIVMPNGQKMDEEQQKILSFMVEIKRLWRNLAFAFWSFYLYKWLFIFVSIWNVPIKLKNKLLWYLTCIYHFLNEIFYSSIIDKPLMN